MEHFTNPGTHVVRTCQKTDMLTNRQFVNCEPFWFSQFRVPKSTNERRKTMKAGFIR